MSSLNLLTVIFTKTNVVKCTFYRHKGEQSMSTYMSAIHEKR